MFEVLYPNPKARSLLYTSNDVISPSTNPNSNSFSEHHKGLLFRSSVISLPVSSYCRGL